MTSDVSDLMKVDLREITLSRLCQYLSESTRGTITKTMLSSPYIYIITESRQGDVLLINFY